MTLRTAIVAAAFTALLVPWPSSAEERPSESDLFGAPAAEAPGPAPAAPPAEGGRDEAILGGAQGARPAGVVSAAQENP
ncbi:MAG TPA: hypothetical protein VLT47_09175, partial [Anaeromyxobacteraceae bacterium]|nr:hypothetical protein [Anaeromyxobacteraceae bacterium]